MSLSIGELAAATGETVKTLRYWTDLGLLPARRGENRYRRYGPDAPTRAAAVRSAQALGLSLADVARLLTACDERGGCRDEARCELEARLSQVRRQIEELRMLETAIATRLEWVERHPELACAVVAELGCA